MYWHFVWPNLKSAVSWNWLAFYGRNSKWNWSSFIHKLISLKRNAAKYRGLCNQCVVQKVLRRPERSYPWRLPKSIFRLLSSCNEELFSCRCLLCCLTTLGIDIYVLLHSINQSIIYLLSQCSYTNSQKNSEPDSKAPKWNTHSCPYKVYELKPL